MGPASFRLHLPGRFFHSCCLFLLVSVLPPSEELLVLSLVRISSAAPRRILFSLSTNELLFGSIRLSSLSLHPGRTRLLCANPPLCPWRKDTRKYDPAFEIDFQLQHRRAFVLWHPTGSHTGPCPQSKRLLWIKRCWIWWDLGDSRSKDAESTISHFPVTVTTTERAHNLHHNNSTTWEAFLTQIPYFNWWPGIVRSRLGRLPAAASHLLGSRTPSRIELTCVPAAVRLPGSSSRRASPLRLFTFGLGRYSNGGRRGLRERLPLLLSFWRLWLLLSHVIGPKAARRQRPCLSG